MNTFLTADYHLGEDRFELMGRPFATVDQMINTLAANHNSMVGKEDLVYMIGDVVYQKKPEFLERVSLFNGKKVLIRGNHDRPIPDKDFKKYFYQIIPEGMGVDLEVEGIKCYLTHYPTRGKEDRFNLVGHVHAAFKYQFNMLNVGVDVHHFCPVNLNKVPFHYKAVCEFFDDDVWVAYNSINMKYLGKRGKKGTYMPK